MTVCSYASYYNVAALADDCSGLWDGSADVVFWPAVNKTGLTASEYADRICAAFPLRSYTAAGHRYADTIQMLRGSGSDVIVVCRDMNGSPFTSLKLDTPTTGVSPYKVLTLSDSEPLRIVNKDDVNTALLSMAAVLMAAVTS